MPGASAGRPVRIAGAGPSGLAAAIALARAGLAVEVHEAKEDVGARFIGDLQVIENNSEAEQIPDLLRRVGIETDFYFRPATWAALHDSRGRKTEVRSRVPYGYFVRRGSAEGSLDVGLLRQARQLGAEVRFRSRLDPSDADVVATGPAVPDGLAKEITFETDAAEVVDVYFDHRRSPGGYSYLFVMDGVATFGCAVVAGFENIDAYFERSLAAARKIRPIDTSRRLRTGYSYMNFHIKDAATLNGARYVGEAGGFQDYLFGLGMRYALTTGHLAARSIIEERDFDALWRAEFPRKAETSLANRFLYELAGNAGLGAFVRLASLVPDFRSYLRWWHRPTWWRSAIALLAKRAWKSDGRCLHKPGAHWCRSRDSRIKVPPLGPVEST
jgi:flavin-dependent dehydrogenase